MNLSYTNIKKYFYSDYYAYQPNIPDKFYLLGKILSENGYRFNAVDEME